MAKDSEDEADLKEIYASEILDKIKRGERVEHDHVIVTGDLRSSNTVILLLQ